MSTKPGEDHDSDEARRQCRRAFGAAVSETAKALGRVQADYETLITTSYDAAIDFGGHPNPKGVLGHLSYTERPDFDEIEFTALYDVGSWHVERSLMACLDYVVIIGIILIHCHAEPTQEAVRWLGALNDRKNEIEEALRST